MWQTVMQFYREWVSGTSWISIGPIIGGFCLYLIGAIRKKAVFGKLYKKLGLAAMGIGIVLGVLLHFST